MNTISVNNTSITGVLSSGDLNNPTRVGSFSDDYELIDVMAGEPVFLNLVSEEFDTYLQIINTDTGEVVASNDDGGTSSNSQLLLNPEASTRYLIRVTGFNEQDLGNYTLSTAQLPDNDLTITTARVPASVKVHEEIDISWTVQNQGSEATLGLPWYDSIHLSTDLVLDESDRLLSNYFARNEDGDTLSLAAGEDYTSNNSLIIPNTAIGDYYLIFSADTYETVLENNEDNNQYAAPIAITGVDVDLAITNAMAPAGAAISAISTTTWTVTNQGSEASADSSWRDYLYLSSDTQLDDNDIFLNSRSYFSTPLLAGDSYEQTVSFALPTSAEAGSQYLIIASDRFNSQFDTNLDNNQTALPFEVSAPDVDLAIAVETSVEGLSVGEALAVTWRIDNNGSDATTTEWYDQVYFSEDAFLGTPNDGSSFDISLINSWTGSLETTPLAGGESYTTTQNLLMPQTGLSSGYLLFVANSRNNQYETNLDNNLVSIPITVGTELPNLVVTEASVPETIIAEQSFSIEWTVENQGLSTAGTDWYSSVYVSQDTVFDESDRYLGTKYAGGSVLIGVGESYTLSETITLAADETTSPYLIFVVDEYDNQPESDETDNFYTLPISAASSDLVVTDATAPVSSVLGETIDISWTVINQGEADANQTFWYDSVYISSDERFDESDTLVTTQYTADPPLAVGNSYTTSLGVVLPQTAIGDRYLLILTDDRNRQGESDESNNTLALPISLSAPNLVVSDAIAPAFGILGEEIEVSWTVENDSSLTASADWYDYIYVSDDEILDNTDRLVASVWAGSNTPLANGTSYTASHTFEIPETAVGDRYLLIAADGSENQGETNEADNVKALPISLSALDVDLVVSDITIPAVANPGAEATIAWTVTNQGADDITDTWNDGIELRYGDTTSFRRRSFSGTIAAGASIERQQVIELPITDDEIEVTIAVDTSNDIIEIGKEDNNRRTATQPIVPVPLSIDLIVSEIIVPAGARPGEEVEVVWTVRNQGSEDVSGSWTDVIEFRYGSSFRSRNYDFTGTLAAGASVERRQLIELPNTESDIEVTVAVDRYNEVIEFGKEDNNRLVADRLITINTSETPNLQVSSIVAPDTAFSSQEIVVDWTVTNAGTGQTNAAYWYDYVWLSTDTTLGNDVYLGRVENASYLEAGDSYASSLTASLPAGIDGTYYFLVQTDYFDNVFELGAENNNLNFSNPTNIDLTPPPDFQVSAVNAPGLGLSGQPLNLSWTVTNAGSGRNLETAWFDEIFLSQDETLDNDDRSIGSFIQSGVINPGENYRTTQSVTLPEDITGNYFAFVKTNAFGSIYEHTFATNNSGYDASAIAIAQTPPPDLIVASATAAPSGEAGKGLQVTWTVTNQGFNPTPTGYWIDRIVASVDGTLGNDDDVSLGVFSHFGALEVDESYDRNELVSLPFNLSGNYQLFVTTDDSDTTYEANAEANNSSAALPVSITPQPNPDLQIASVSTAVAGGSGAPFTVDWVVKNLGTGATNTSYWYDEVYLSADASLNKQNDIFLGRRYHSGQVSASGEYAATLTATLPNELVGDYYAFVVTDSSNRVFEGALENNNSKATDSRSTISRSAVPDLAIGNLIIPTEGFSGQSIELSWDVSNSGANTTGSWRDVFYLSRDQVFDRNSDTYLGFVEHTAGLAGNAAYTKTQAFELSQGIAGQFYVFGVSDSGDRIYERGAEENNVVLSSNPLQITQAPPADLVAGLVTVPANAFPGQSTTLTYSVTNQGENAAIGTWNDSIYLSANDRWDVEDALLDRVQISGPLASGSEYSQTVTAVLPGILPGDYYAIVRSDIRNAVEETNEANNLSLSVDQSSVDAAVLELDSPSDGTLSSDQSVYYRIDVPAGETVLLNFDSTSTTAANELYVRYGEIPSRSKFDFGFSEAFSPDQQIVIPNTLGGTYYVLAYGDSVPGTPAAFTISAEVLEFSLLDIGTSYGSNRGEVTITLEGAELTSDTVAKLIAADGTERVASQVLWRSSTELWATFDLQGSEIGDYDVQIEASGKTAGLEDVFSVTSGTTGQLETRLITPNALRPGQSGNVTVEYTNVGETDLVAPLLTLGADNAGLRFASQSSGNESSIQFLAINQEGPAGILTPGATGQFTFTISPSVEDGTISFSLSEAAADDSINWERIKAASQPTEVSDDAWEVIWNNFTNAVGTTAESYQQELARNATHLSLLGELVADVSRLMAFEMRQASNQLLGATLVSSTDIESITPGIGLSIERSFGTSIEDRFDIGDLGRGWKHQWEISAVTDDSGSVTVKDYNSSRFFAKQADGSYQNLAGDGATLKAINGLYVLSEGNGTNIAFYENGSLDYVEDKRKNRVTASYSSERLASLVHSNGDQLSFSFSEQGRLSQVIDETGRTTTYRYDEAGDHLLSVSDIEGAVSYAYETTKGLASEHAIRSIELADGTITTFDYDAQGRLLQRSQEGEAQSASATYRYDAAGQITITDGLGETTQLWLTDQSAVGRIVDALGQTTQFQQDTGGNLAQLVNPDRTISNFSYDERGNLVEMQDALGHQIYFTYDAADRPQSFQDQRGNTTTYSHDGEGNLQSVTYADNSSATYSHDDVGNLTVSVNRRNQTTNYTYSAKGLLTQKDYADGTSSVFTYDDRGNLLTATDADSTVSYSYNNAERLAKVAYGDERFLTFEYDAGGRRTQIADQDDFTVNYSYDAVGRLQQLTNGNNERIISYEYDADDRLVKETNGNSTYTTYGYDSVGQVLSIVNYTASDSINSRYGYEYDTAGRRTRMTTLEGDFSYEYDVTGQLTSVTLPDDRKIEYQYDAAGNRTTVVEGGTETSYLANNLNQYLTAGETTYTYDADGNLTGKTQGTNNWTYGYDSDSQLIEVAGPDGTWNYEYDPVGNRIATIKDGIRTEYLIDPSGFGHVVGEYNSDGTSIASYVQGIGLVSQVSASNLSSYYDADAIGSITGLTGADGSYLNEYSYLPFGEELAKTETVSNPFEFIGQWGVMDEGNGLDFMRERYYDSTTGQFVSEDPIGLRGGDANTRRYVQNNPVNDNDPLGLGYFSKRPLNGLGNWQGNSGLLDYLNLEASHEHYFFDDGSDIGFGPDGRFEESDTSKYKGESQYYDDEIIREALDNLKDNDYDVFNREDADNCQQWAERLRDEYDRIKKERERNKKETDIRRPLDPNDIIGPAGFGEENWISADATLPYTIRFENQAIATAPAQQVVITHPLDPDLDWRTFRLGSFGWGGMMFAVPENRSFYQERLNLVEGFGFYVDVFATIDVEKGVSTWTITTVDPETGEIPEDALAGFLPPNDQTGVGDGFVTYRIRSSKDATTGDVIDAKATIVFDTEEPIDTPPIFHTLDSGSPTGSVADLPALVEAESGEFLVSWSGSDDADGSGLAGYTIYVSDNNGDFTPWLSDTILTEATYQGEAGHSYEFYVVATDNAGNTQDIPTASQASTRVAGGMPNLVSLSFDAFSDHVLLGQTNISFAVANQGASTATEFKVDVIYSDDDIIGNDDDIVVETLSFAAIEAGAEVTYNGSIQLSLELLNSRAIADDITGLGNGHTSSSYDYLGIIIDPENSISEVQTDDNYNQGKGIDKDDITYFPWDFDSNGLVTPTDAIYVINRLGQTTSDDNRLADLDGNGLITPTDAIATINRLGYSINSSVFE